VPGTRQSLDKVIRQVIAEASYVVCTLHCSMQDIGLVAQLVRVFAGGAADFPSYCIAIESCPHVPIMPPLLLLPFR
jgi:hypothetical protein